MKNGTNVTTSSQREWLRTNSDNMFSHETIFLLKQLYEIQPSANGRKFSSAASNKKLPCTLWVGFPSVAPSMFRVGISVAQANGTHRHQDFGAASCQVPQLQTIAVWERLAIILSKRTSKKPFNFLKRGDNDLPRWSGYYSAMCIFLTQYVRNNEECILKKLPTVEHNGSGEGVSGELNHPRPLLYSICTSKCCLCSCGLTC